MSLLGLDIGTSVCKAAVYAENGALLSLASREYPTTYGPHLECFLDSFVVSRAIQDAIREASGNAKTLSTQSITAISVGSMGEAFVPLSQKGELLGESVLGIDPRGAEYLHFFDRLSPEQLYQISPNFPGPWYSYPKIRWLMDHDPEQYASVWKFLSWADYAVYMLTGEATASFSLANRTFLFDFFHECWSKELLDLSGILESKLGRVVPGGTVVGTVKPDIAETLGLSPKVLVVAGGHDQCLAALGAGAIEKGTAVCSIGTVECITPIFDSVPDPALFKRHNLNIEHHVIPNRYVSFVYNQAGSLQKWFSRVFTDAEMASSTGPEVYNRLASEMPKEPTNLLVLPFFEPTGAPLFMSDNYGCILGLTTATTRGEIFKAIVEGITYYFADALDKLSQMGLPIDSFVAVGGGARSDAWLQIQADILGRPIARSANVEAGTLGAAILAGTTTGVFKDTELAVQKFVKIERVFEPNKAHANAYQNSLGLYRSIHPELRGRLRKR